MKLNHWTLALAAAGVVTMGTVAQAEEATESVKTLVSGTTISGYVSTSAIWRPGTGGQVGLTPAFIGAGAGSKQDGFNLDVVDLTISKALDESEWASGYKVDLWYGPDTTGTVPGVLSAREIYVALRAPIGNGLNIKVGAFNTLVGYESTQYTENFHYTRSWGWAVEPTTHTGVLLNYRFSDLVAVSAGIANAPATIAGVNAVNGRLANNGAIGSFGSESSKQYMGAIELTAPEGWGFLSGSKMNVAAIQTPRSGAAVVRDQDMTHLYAGATLNTPVDAWKVGIAYDYVANSGAGVVAHKSDYQSVWGLYNTYQATEKLKVGIRGEYATGSESTLSGIAQGATGDTDRGEAFVALTTTVDYSLWENVISRLELRWDKAVSGGAGSGAGSPSSPFGGNSVVPGVGTANDESNSFLVALNLIYKF